MAEAIRYKPPRLVNPVSVTIALIIGSIVFAGYQYLPLYFQKLEAYRVLEETGSKFSARRNFYLSQPTARETLRRQMEADLRHIGVNDPEMETWIEVEGKEASLGVVYSEWVEWPFGLIEPTEHVYQSEHFVRLL
jgi:hypothetical protein